MTFPKFEYLAPQTLDEAISILEEKGPEVRVMAGGTDLLVKMRQGLLKPRTVVSLKRIQGLDKISFDRKDGLRIGATALLADVASHPSVRSHYPAVAYAASETANVQIRNMGTVAGNLCNAAPSADNAPVLTAMGACVVLAGPRGERSLPLDAFFLGPGLTAREPSEILTEIRVPFPRPGTGTSYQHLSARGKVDISAVGVGVMLRVEGKTCREAGIILGAVAPTPLRARRTEKLLVGKSLTADLLERAGRSAAAESAPISDVRATASYRRKMVAVLTRRALSEAYERARRNAKKR